MKIVINSNDKGNVALNHLLESMKSCEEYNEYEIIIVIGGYYANTDCYDISQHENITYIKCNFNNLDLTGLTTLMELYSHDVDAYYVYLHDTCKVGKKFYKKIKSIDLTNVSSIRINKIFSMNIGIYSQKIINSFQTDLSIKNTDESKMMLLKTQSVCHEDIIFKNDVNNIILDNYDGWNYTGPTDYYNTGTMRIVEYYENLDLFKIKANWYWKDVWCLNV
uniref:Glycosyltransferase n=1 Tax=viral metagenome TaxID=1070528 RepID=A0A6C0F166_9ZZZZ